MSYCVHCGAELNEGDAFCAKCGAAQGVEATQTSRNEVSQTSESFDVNLKSKISTVSILSYVVIALSIIFCLWANDCYSAALDELTQKSGRSAKGILRSYFSNKSGSGITMDSWLDSFFSEAPICIVLSIVLIIAVVFFFIRWRKNCSKAKTSMPVFQVLMLLAVLPSCRVIADKAVVGFVVLGILPLIAYYVLVVAIMLKTSKIKIEIQSRSN